MSAAADGERSALRGYAWQYNQLAARVYDSLCDDTFELLRLVDPEVGKVDDLVLVTTRGSSGFQFKSQEFVRPLTLGQLLKVTPTRSGGTAASLIWELASGWKILDDEPGMATVHLCTNKPASASDHLGVLGDPDRPSPDSFAVFIQRVLEPLRSGELNLDGIRSGWRPALESLRNVSGLDEEEFARFLTALQIETSLPDVLQTPDAVRRGDIDHLSKTLMSCVARAGGAVVLDRLETLAIAGWTNRVRLQSAHDFHVDLDTYEPLDSAVDDLRQLLNSTTSGYLATVGPPGSGKSTLLSQALSGTEDRLVHYFAYVPGPGHTRSRFEAFSFLHDLVLTIGRSLSTNRGHLLEESITDLRLTLQDQLETAAAEFSKTGRRTLIVVDGLDHVERDYSGSDNLLAELPLPEQLRDGVVFIVGTRTLSPLHSKIREQVENGRQLNLGNHRLSQNSVLNICARIVATANLGEEVHQRIAQLASGHPLSLAYLLNKMVDVASPDAALELLAGAVQYEGDISAQYREIWDHMGAEPQELIAVVARLRIDFTYGDLLDWFSKPTVRDFRDNLTFLFRTVGSAWRVFHDSFRQFIIERSNVGDGSPSTDPIWDSAYHAQVAIFCAQASRQAMRWEELYHRHRSGQDVGDYASQALFREQSLELRSPELIREDVATVLQTAAEDQDLLKLIAALLSRVELEARLQALEQVDVPGAYINADLPKDAIEFTGINQQRQVPLAQAYNLAAWP